MTKAAAKKKEVTEDSKLAPKKMAPKPDAIKKIMKARFQQAEHARQFVHIQPEAKHTIKDLLKPEYWSLVADKVQRQDRIEALWEDNSRLAEFVVLDKGDTWVRVALLSDYELTTASDDAPADSEGFTVEHVNNHVKWAVIRNSDGKRVSEGHDSKESAQQEALSQKQAMGR